MDRDEFGGVAFGVDPTFTAGLPEAPVAADIAGEALQPLDAIGSRSFEHGLDVSSGSSAAVVALRARSAVWLGAQRPRRAAAPVWSPARGGVGPSRSTGPNLIDLSH